MTRDDLDTLREGIDFEAKLAAGLDGRGELPRTFWETCAAFANTQGGRIVLGLKEVDDGFDIRGIADPHKVESDLWSTLNNRQKISAQVFGPGAVRRVEVDGRTLLIIEIPRAPRELRPVYLGGNPLTGTWLRLGEGDVRADEATVRRMLADAQVNPQTDKQPLEHLTFAELDPDTITRYRNVFSARHYPQHPFLAGDALHFLKSIGAWAIDYTTRREGPTRAGLLLFGVENAIKYLYPHFQLDYREIGPDPAARWIDRVTLDGTFTGNVYQFFGRAYPRLVERLKVPFKLDENQVRIDDTPQHKAVREALVNALIHADYSVPQGIVALRTPTGFEFQNPGTLLVDEERIREGGQSVCRNPTLQHLLFLIGLGEKAGSGYGTIRQAWKGQHWFPPRLTETFGPLARVKLELPTVSFVPAEILAELGAHWPRRLRELDEPARAVLAALTAEGEADHARLLSLVDVHSRDLTLILQKLKRGELVEQLGHGRGSRYRVWFERSDARRAESSVQSATVQSATVQSATVQSATVQSAKTWARREFVAEQILEACRDRFLTLRELAEAVGRTPETVRIHYLRDLLAKGRLELRHPEQPRHPEQAYQARGDS
jgi:ATP-dependent DNA helicase RecG